MGRNTLAQKLHEKLLAQELNNNDETGKQRQTM